MCQGVKLLVVGQKSHSNLISIQTEGDEHGTRAFLDSYVDPQSPRLPVRCGGIILSSTLVRVFSCRLPEPS
jgi:hypothetical protein